MTKPKKTRKPSGPAQIGGAMVDIKVTKIELVPIKSIHPWSENINKHPKSQIEELAEQFEFNGMSNVIEVEEETNDIVCGVGRWMAAKKLGMSHVPVFFRTYESYSHKYARMVADNGSAKKSELDLSMLAKNLENLHLDDPRLLCVPDFQFEPILNQDPEPADKLIECPNCSHKFKKQ